MVTPISAVLRAATGDCDPVYGGCRCVTPYTTKKSRSHSGFLRRSQGHRQFSSAVTRSLAVFGRSQIVTPVAALSTAHIGVTTPCLVLDIPRVHAGPAPPVRPYHGRTSFWGGKWHCWILTYESVATSKVSSLRLPPSKAMTMYVFIGLGFNSRQFSWARDETNMYGTETGQMHRTLRDAREIQENLSANSDSTLTVTESSGSAVQSTKVLWSRAHADK